MSPLHVVHVEPPTLAETRKLFERVFAGEVRRTMLQGFDIEISKSILNHVVGTFSVREFKTRASTAIGRALVRKHLCAEGGLRHLADREGQANGVLNCELAGGSISKAPNEPADHGERSVAIGTIDMPGWSQVAKIEDKPLLQIG